jgi:hypothetical protein
MNEQIRECWLKAAREDAGETWDTQEQFIERFAELIVRECIECGNELAKHYIDNLSEREQVPLLASIADYSSAIKKNFGVE